MGQRVQIVLDAQQLKRVFAVPIDQVSLKLLQAGYLHCGVPRVGDDSGDDERQPEKKACSRGFLGEGSARAWLILLAFLNRHNLPAGYIRQLVDLPARPADFNLLCAGALAQTESEYAFALRKIAGSTLHHCRLSFTARRDTHNRPQCVSVGARADKAKPQAAIRAASVIAEENGRSIIGSHDDVEVAVVVVSPQKRRRGKPSDVQSRRPEVV